MKKITEQHLIEQIASKEFIHPETQPTMTLCVLLTKNGCAVVGQSACVDPSIFNKNIGQNVAYKDAVSKLWQLEGYLLRQKIYESTKH
tara:strand:+ start:2826 stop:3089 length:264 start_codon:yes stop_codon:yes gene_type:complete